MATTNPLSSNIDSLTSLLGLFTGKKTSVTTSGGSSSEQTIVSEEGIKNLIRSLMEGTSGLAAVSSGQKAPGMYNSTTRQLMTNDLLARVGGQAAERSAVKVTNKDPIIQTTKVAAPIDSKTGLLAGAALLLGSKKARKGLLDGLGLDDLLSMGIPLESGNASSGNAAAGAQNNDPWNSRGSFPTAFDNSIDNNAIPSFVSNLNFSPMSSDMSAAAFTPFASVLPAEQLPPAPVLEPMPEPVVTPTPEPVVTPTPEPVVTPPTVEAVPDVVQPPAPVTPPVVAAPPAPPSLDQFIKPSKSNGSYPGGSSGYEADVARLITALNTYNSTYGATYKVVSPNGYSVTGITGGAAPVPTSTGGGTSTPFGYNLTVDNLFQGNLGAFGSSGGNFSVDNTFGGFGPIF
jgi:hypothetical protein